MHIWLIQHSSLIILFLGNDTFYQYQIPFFLLNHFGLNSTVFVAQGGIIVNNVIMFYGDYIMSGEH